MSRFAKIYVVTLHNFTTGGVELTHQLVDYLRRKGAEAYIVYMKDNKVSADQTVTDAYKCYDIKTTNQIEDHADNLLVLPEIFYDLIYEYTKIKIGCWWMSVDNHYAHASLKDRLMFKPSFTKCYKLLTRYFKYPERRYKNSLRFIKKQQDRIYHFYQSCYAQMHFYSKGLGKIIPLTDYIHTTFAECSKNTKKNIVLYNPQKGYKFTNKIIKLLPEIQFVPLKNLNREQLSSLLSEAKLYIDFGHFPGKDRMPREAVISGCCILTGTEGASFYYEDVPIDNKYKIQKRLANLPVIVDKIKYILQHYDECARDFDYFKSQVLREREIFPADRLVLLLKRHQQHFNCITLHRLL